MLFPALASMLALAGLVPAAASAPAVDDPIVVTTEWLAARLHDPHLVLFEIGRAEQYATRHIPGAQRLDFHDIAAPHDMNARPMGLALELPSAAQFDSTMSAKGVSSDSHIVVYFADDWVTPAARAVLTFEAAGLRGRVSFLDGGLPAWVAEGRPVTADGDPRAFREPLPR
jgi:thiosulfate/3-mercaptopyruvate sulfurtransferase